MTRGNVWGHSHQRWTWTRPEAFSGNMCSIAIDTTMNVKTSYSIVY